MKLSKFLLTVLAITAFTACNNDDQSGLMPSNEVKSLSVTLQLPITSGSRATGPVDVLTKDTLNVNSVLVNLTNASGVVLESVLVMKDTNIGSDWSKLTTATEGLKFINIPSSVAKVEIYGNPGDAVDSDNIVKTDVENQQGSAVLYYGYDDELTPVQTEPINPDPTNGTTYTAEVAIAPIVARMQVNSISFQTNGDFEYSRTINGELKKATVTWEDFSADVKGIYFNNFYHTYNKPGTLEDLMNNLTYQGTIYDGLWVFPSLNPSIEASAYAAYVNYNDGVYANLPLSTTNKTYGFNFFPGSVIPTIHIDLANIEIENLKSTDDEVFNPAVVEISRFANISVFYKNSVTEMVASDFTAGTIYNMDIEIIPALDTDLKNVQYNILVYVTMTPWAETTIIPGFDLSE